MRNFCPLQIKVWALSWWWGDADLDGWLRTGSCEQEIAVPLWVQAAWCVNRTEEWAGANPRADRAWAVVCEGWDTHRPSSHPWLERWQFLIRNGLHSPLTGAALQISAASEQFFAFCTLGRKRKKELMWVSEPQLHAVSPLEKPAWANAALLQPKACQGWDTQAHQAQGTSEQCHQCHRCHCDTQTSLFRLRNFC